MLFTNFLNKKYIINLLFALFPISFIFGNPAVNLNIILIILYTLFIYKTRIFFFKFNLADKLLIVFFFLALISIIFNSIENFFVNDQTYVEYFLKTVFFFRYLFFYFSLRYLLINNLLKLNLFLIFSSISVIFVAFDIYYQFYFGKDIFGYTTSHYKISGPFGDELVAGSYLQRFSLFLFLSSIFFLRNKNKFIKDSIIILLILFIFISILISGNRMPSLLFFLILLIVIIYLIPSRKYLLILLIFFPLMSLSVVGYNEKVRNNFGGLYDRLVNTTYNYYFNKQEFTVKKVPEHIWHFKSGIDTWSMNKVIGGGIKSFRFNCWKALAKNNSTWSCATHPHNYYIEILADLGLIGFLIIIMLFSYCVYFFKSCEYKKMSWKDNYLLKILFLLILAEFFPIKSSGSFFSTFNAAYIFLILSLFFSIISKKSNYE